ncbi:MAG: VWA domain-containing protein [Phycisphaerales bacterium]|nr:VWA domain-containing protein [Phycisphaerales bacterium]
MACEWLSQNGLALILPLSVDRPAWLWLLLLIPVLAVVSWRVLVAIQPARRVLVIAVRSLVILALALCLADVMYVRTTDKLTVFFLMDRSDSVKDLQEVQEQYLAAVSEQVKNNPDDRVGMIDFATNAYLQQLPMLGGYHVPVGRLPEMDHRDRTDVAAAIRLALAMFPPDSAKRIVLMSDGNDNMGNILMEAENAQAAGVQIDVVPLWYEHNNEVYFDKLVAPTRVGEGDVVPLRMLLHAERATGGHIEIYHNGRLVEIPKEDSKIALKPGSNPFTVKLPVQGGGPQRFEARFVPDDPERGDSIEENNTATSFSFVTGKSKVLLLTMRMSDDQALVDALAEENIDVEVRDVSSGDLDLLDLMSYSVVILANVPANTFTTEQQMDIVNYVSNLGGGLIMTGGDEAYGAGGWIGTPLAEVMPVHFEIKHKRVIPRGALAIICHSCEIARGNYWGTEVAKKSVDTISSRDYFGVLTYSWSPGGVNWDVPLQLATNKNAIKNRIDKMVIGDMPDFDTTMRMAVKGLSATDAAQKHVIIISDGDPSPPAASVIADMKKNKITCSTIGIGFGSHVMEASLKDIAKQTGGKYYPCRNPKTLPKIFVKESKVVRRSLISEERFSPQVQYFASEMLAGISAGEALPPLGGLVLTSPKDEAQIALVRLGKDGVADPVLAHWQAGLGRAVAFTSGFWPRWGDAWVSWPKYSKLWSQIVRWSMRQEAPANLDVFTRITGNEGTVVVDAVDKDSSALNMLALPGVIIKPDQQTEQLVFTQTGPGHYEAKFKVDQTGQYIANVAVNENGVSQGSIQTGVSVPFSPEFRELTTNVALLEKVKDITGGRWHEDISQAASHPVFDHDMPPTRAKEPVWEWVLAWILLPLFLLDVAVRRLASWFAFSVVLEIVLLVVLLFGVGIAHSGIWGIIGVVVLVELIGWSMRFRSIGPLIDSLTSNVATLGQAGERSTASIGQLKGVRDRVQDERSEKSKSKPATGSTQTPEIDRSARFDVGDDAAKIDAGSLRESIDPGTTSPKDKPQAPKQPDRDAADGDDEDATSRLLRAKRRARRDMDEDQNK